MRRNVIKNHTPQINILLRNLLPASKCETISQTNSTLPLINSLPHQMLRQSTIPQNMDRLPVFKCTQTMATRLSSKDINHLHQRCIRPCRLIHMLAKIMAGGQTRM